MRTVVFTILNMLETKQEQRVLVKTQTHFPSPGRQDSLQKIEIMQPAAGGNPHCSMGSSVLRGW